MSARSHRLRVRLLGTIGVFWFAAAMVIGFQAWQDAETTNRANESLQRSREQNHPLMDGFFERHGYGTYGAETDWATFVAQLGLVTLIALVLAGAVWIWTKPGEDLDAMRLAGASKADPPKQPAPARPAKQTPTPAPIETTAPTVEADPEKLSRSEVSEALRELKALHDDGILTDDEYETKRQALTDQL